MLEPNCNWGSFYTNKESEEEALATADDVSKFNKQYDTMAGEKKARLPNWLQEIFTI